MKEQKPGSDVLRELTELCAKMAKENPNTATPSDYVAYSRDAFIAGIMKQARGLSGKKRRKLLAYLQRLVEKFGVERD